MLAEATAAVEKAGFRLMLSQDWRCWQASALGPHPEMTPTGAMYTRAIGTGKTADAALAALIEELAKRPEKPVPVTKPPEPVQMALDDNFDDLC